MRSATAPTGCIGHSHPDGLTLVGVVALVGIVSLVAASVPAWRATRIDPQALLRSE
ncbi:MAG TPA: hypothetical protein VGI16_14345 [Candidatus Acidoferrum sp.]